jgi:hypothetical protein
MAISLLQALNEDSDKFLVWQYARFDKPLLRQPSSCFRQKASFTSSLTHRCFAASLRT